MFKQDMHPIVFLLLHDDCTMTARGATLPVTSASRIAGCPTTSAAKSTLPAGVCKIWSRSQHGLSPEYNLVLSSERL